MRLIVVCLCVSFALPGFLWARRNPASAPTPMGRCEALELRKKNPEREAISILGRCPETGSVLLNGRLCIPPVAPRHRASSSVGFGRSSRDECPQ